MTRPPASSTIGTRRRRVPIPGDRPDGVSMPTYVYRCAKCGEQIEAFQSFADAPLTKHTECGGKLTKVLSAAGIVLKGSGFYKTDNRSSSKGASKEQSKESTLGSSSLGFRLLGLVGLGAPRSRPSRSRPKPAPGSGRRARARARRAAPKPRARSPPRSRARDAGRHRRLRRFGFLQLRRRRRGGRPRDAVRRAERAGDDRRDRRTARRVHPAPRPRPRVRAGARPGAGQPLGDAHARRAPGDRAVRGRVRCRPTSIPATSSCSTNSSTARGVGPTRSTTRARRTTSRTPTRTARSSRGTRSRRANASACGCTTRGTVVVDPRPALLDACRVALVPLRGLARRQHDAVSRGVPRPRARHALRGHRARHRLRHRASKHDAGVAPVSQEQVFAFFEENLHRVRALLHDLIPRCRDEPSGCACADAVGPLPVRD